jgi:UDP-N-acetylmuramoylalanine--D-glutamate ligase
MKAPRIVVLGGGESGAGAAVLAKLKGFEVFLSDAGTLKDEHRDVLYKYEIPFEEHGHTEALILNADEVIKSPGIPEKVALIQKLIHQGTPVISEIEFAKRYTKAPCICITGSNGKTTTTMLTWHILNKAGLKVGLGGNVGKSFAMQVATEDYDLYVLEISSFQLDGMFEFKADIAILTNITPDHLDRYEYDFDKYAASKLRIIRNQTEKDSFIWCCDDKKSSEIINKLDLKQRVYAIGLEKKSDNQTAWIEDDRIIIKTDNNQFDMELEKLALQGKHNLYNSMAAAIAGSLSNVRKPVIKESLSDFQNVEHRLEYVANVHGIEFINDSKATNVNSTWYALESQSKPIIWIAGGRDKGNDYTELIPLVKQKVKAIICLGIENEKIKETFGDMVEIIAETQSAQEAVQMAYNMGTPGDVVLLSPACASFDLFENFEDRGCQFKKAVKRL